MVRMLFFIRFLGQLRRVEPGLAASIEDTAANAASAAGGTVEPGRRFLSASFNTDRIGFWFGMVILLEKLRETLNENARALPGYAAVLDLDTDNREMPAEQLCRFLSGRDRKESTGIWCSPGVQEALEPYLVFGPPFQGAAPAGYREFRELKLLGRGGREYPYRVHIERALARVKGKNTVLSGPEFTGKKDGIRQYCAAILGSVPPLEVSFGTVPEAGGPGDGPRGNTLVYFADAFTPEIRAFVSCAASPDLLEELDSAAGVLFRERLREELPPYMLDLSRRFIRTLLGAYAASAGPGLDGGVLVFENPSLAGPVTAGIFMEAYSSLAAGERPLVLAADSSPGENPAGWDGFFPAALRFSPEDLPGGGGFSAPYVQPPPLKLPPDLWELAYTLSLLGRYFPPRLFPRLSGEEGLSGDLYSHAAGALEALGAAEAGDPRPRVPHFLSRAGQALGGRQLAVRAAVRNRLLAWVGAGRISPCFNLLKILPWLGGRAADDLVLRSLTADVLNGTWAGIEEAIAGGSFDSITGERNAPVLLYVYRTLKALAWGGKDEIRQAFEAPVPSPVLEGKDACYTGCMAQVYTNLAAFHIGSGNYDAAPEPMRKAMHLNRGLGEHAVPAYRFFSLLNFCRQRISDALEYIGFALDQAEKEGLDVELAVSCYFASSINFIHGNLSKAERLARRSEETASASGQPGWAARAGFFRGRLCFETGRYADALEIFEKLRCLQDSGAGAALPTGGEMAGTVLAWANRARVFLGQPVEGGSGAWAGRDGRLFRIEALYSAADYRGALDLAERFLSSPDGESPEGGDFLFTCQPDWRSGFAQCESMFLPEKAHGAKLAWFYRALARTALLPDPEAKAGILGAVQRFMRDGLCPDTDTNDGFYFHAWYSMLRDSTDSGVSRADMTTVLSRAYKRLQRRAGRIDDAAVKQDFLTLPRWNSAISLAAREYKLI